MKASSANYYSGGVAQIVECPTPLTYSFLSHWFSGAHSYGDAMKLLHIPYTAWEDSILAQSGSDLVLDLSADERILYEKTVLSYSTQQDIHDTPTLHMNVKKLFSLTCIKNTLNLIITQGTWIANPERISGTLHSLVTNIDSSQTTLPIEDLDRVITDKVLPIVIAVGYVAQYLHQYLMHELKGNTETVNAYIAHRVSQKDWIYQSLTDQQKVKSHTMSFNAYMECYGIRADRDFELDCPRWKEIPDSIEKRIEQSIPVEMKQVPHYPDSKLTPIIESCIALQILRTTVKQKALLYIDALRQHILIHTQQLSSRAHLKREYILQGKFPKNESPEKKTEKNDTKKPSHKSGSGTPVSSGTCTGVVRHISDPNASVPPGTIGVFPNASPEFSILFPKCAGIIFARGGQTSHGAIVAREFGIPAIIEKNALSIPEGKNITLNGAIGTWHVV